jgi:intron-binding protein aquarius
MDGTEGPSSGAASETAIVHARPTVADLHGENHFAQVARKNWLAAKKTPKVRPEVVKKELWDELESVDFAYSSLLVLENLQLLERYLWPGFTEDASDYHHLLLALMVNVKRRENLPSWGRSCIPASSARALTGLQNTSPASPPSSPRSSAASCP